MKHAIARFVENCPPEDVPMLLANWRHMLARAQAQVDYLEMLADLDTKGTRPLAPLTRGFDCT